MTLCRAARQSASIRSDAAIWRAGTGFCMPPISLLAPAVDRLRERSTRCSIAGIVLELEGCLTGRNAKCQGYAAATNTGLEERAEHNLKIPVRDGTAVPEFTASIN